MKKMKKIITSIMLVMAMCIFAVQPAFAAGTETWYSSHGNYDAAYTFNDDNLTPVKTMGDSGTLVVFGDFKKADSGSSNVKLTAEIRAYPSGTVLDRIVVDNTNYPNPNLFALSTHVTAGQKIQIYFDASSVSNPPGFLRSAYVDYSAYIAP